MFECKTFISVREIKEIQDITGEHIDTDNEYMYYYSVEFIK